MPIGPLELGIILVIIIIIFGVGKLPEIGGALGRGIREFKDTSRDDEEEAAKQLDDSPARGEVRSQKTNEPAKEEL